MAKASLHPELVGTFGRPCPFLQVSQLGKLNNIIEKLINRRDDPGTCLESPLKRDELDKLIGDINRRQLKSA